MRELLRRWLNPEKNSVAPITIVSGLPRSGTSLMMRMLETGGLPILTDNLRSADIDNPHGYYEFERVKQLEKGDTTWLGTAGGKAVKVISALLHSLPPDRSYYVIFMMRDLNEVLASQRQMMQRRHTTDNRGEDVADDAELAALFQAHLRDTQAWLMRQPQMATLYVDYSALLSDTDAQVRRIQNFLDFPLDTGQMVRAVDPTLYRNRQPRQR
jgi:hypothetical protein